MGGQSLVLERAARAVPSHDLDLHSELLQLARSSAGQVEPRGAPAGRGADAGKALLRLLGHLLWHLIALRTHARADLRADALGPACAQSLDDRRKDAVEQPAPTRMGDGDRKSVV